MVWLDRASEVSVAAGSGLAQLTFPRHLSKGLRTLIKSLILLVRRSFLAARAALLALLLLQ